VDNCKHRKANKLGLFEFALCPDCGEVVSQFVIGFSLNAEYCDVCDNPMNDVTNIIYSADQTYWCRVCRDLIYIKDGKVERVKVGSP
jgi:hypothetical protein